MRYVNMPMRETSAAGVRQGAFSRAFLMDEHPTVTTVAEWITHAQKFTRSQCFSYDPITKKAQGTKVCGIKDGKAVLGRGPSLNLEFNETMEQNYITYDQMSYRDVRWTSARVKYVTYTLESWQANIESMFFYGEHTILGKSYDKEGLPLSPTNRTTDHHILYTALCPTGAYPYTGGTPDNKIPANVRTSTSGYKKEMKEQLEYVYFSRPLTYATPSTPVGTYVNTVSGSLSVSSGVSTLNDMRTYRGKQYNYTDGGSTWEELQVEYTTTTMGSALVVDMTGPIYPTFTTTDPDSPALVPTYGVMAVADEDDRYLVVLKNGTDFTATATAVGNNVDVTLTNLDALKTYSGDLLMNLGGTGAIR